MRWSGGWTWAASSRVTASRAERCTRRRTWPSAIAELAPRLERLKKSGLAKLSRTGQDARFLRERGGVFALGYSAEIAVSDDHLIVAQRVTQNTTDNASLAPLLDQVRQRCGALPAAALADSGFFSMANLEHLEEHKHPSHSSLHQFSPIQPILPSRHSDRVLTHTLKPLSALFATLTP